MQFAIYISRNNTDPFVPMFEIIYIIEVHAVMIIKIIIKFQAIIYYLYYTRWNLVRLRLIFPVLVGLIHSLSRLFVMHHQYFGPSEYVETYTLIYASMIKQIFFGYMTVINFIVAMDRWVATKAWSWYERCGKTTLLFFAVQETTLNSIFVHLQLFVLVLRWNKREMRLLKRGAVINRYSVSRTYQIKENISVLTSYIKVSRPKMAFSTPPFVSFAIFLLVPANAGFDGLRYFSAAMFDLWLSLS
ncbi:hypothetical protein PMAYCL1PPCAC_32142, partial [Pristionchus mayeri]